jgi:hypothetical protein
VGRLPCGPDVRGLQANRALRQVHEAKFRNVRFVTQRSAKEVGVVLAQRPRADEAARVVQQLQIVISGGSAKVGALVGVPGASTCSFAITPPRRPCMGGPVLARVQAPRRRRAIRKVTPRMRNSSSIAMGSLFVR